MNYVEVLGGLGNQLFQYAFKKYCEKISGHDTLLHTEFFDYVKSLPGATKRDFTLEKFRCDFVGIQGNIVCERIIEEETFPGIEQDMNEVFFRGYWQKKTFFEEVKSELLSEICLKNEYITEDLYEAAKKIESGNSVVVHFRRADYLTGDNVRIFCSLPVEYYKSALSEVVKRCGRDVKAFLFTDDPDYVSGIMSELADIDMELMSMREDYEDLYLMSLAKHHIIANSTFSWWGAALSKDPNGITIAPKNWFLDRPSPNLYLDDWLVM